MWITESGPRQVSPVGNHTSNLWLHSQRDLNHCAIQQFFNGESYLIPSQITGPSCSLLLTLTGNVASVSMQYRVTDVFVWLIFNEERLMHDLSSDLKSIFHKPHNWTRRITSMKKKNSIKAVLPRWKQETDEDCHTMDSLLSSLKLSWEASS